MQTQLEKNLIAARDLIKDPKNWMKGGIGHRSATDSEPEAWCVSRAVQHVVREHDRRVEALRALLMTFSDEEKEIVFNGVNLRILDCEGTRIGFYNDNHGHADVMAMFNRAIAAEQAKQLPPRKPRVKYDWSALLRVPETQKEELALQTGVKPV